MLLSRVAAVIRVIHNALKTLLRALRSRYEYRNARLSVSFARVNRFDRSPRNPLACANTLFFLFFAATADDTRAMIVSFHPFKILYFQTSCYYPYGNILFTSLWSAPLISVERRNRRRRAEFFEDIRCLRPAFRRKNLPRAVILTRFAIDFFVFNFLFIACSLLFPLTYFTGIRTIKYILPSICAGLSILPTSAVSFNNRSMIFIPIS